MSIRLLLVQFSSLQPVDKQLLSHSYSQCPLDPYENSQTSTFFALIDKLLILLLTLLNSWVYLLYTSYVLGLHFLCFFNKLQVIVLKKKKKEERLD
jgi:hypothetical protein